MKQLTLAAVGFERYAKTTPRAAFLGEMERVVPWSTPTRARPAPKRAGAGCRRRAKTQSSAAQLESSRVAANMHAKLLSSGPSQRFNGHRQLVDLRQPEFR